MKKLLGILVLGLVLSSNAYAYDSTKYAICYGEMTNAQKAETNKKYLIYLATRDFTRGVLLPGAPDLTSCNHNLAAEATVL